MPKDLIVYVHSNTTELKLSTTTTGKRSDEIPPGGKEKSSLVEEKAVSEYPPFARYEFKPETLELATPPFPLLLRGSVFISDIFFIFFS